MSSAPKSGEIFAAMVAVMGEVGTIGKSRKNAAQGYDFRGIDDVVANLQEVMAKHGVLCVPRVLEREREVFETKNGGKMASVRLLVEHTFFSAKDGSAVHATTLGEAMDSGDKASNKAMSAALKYALTETFLIPTREADRDTEEASPEMAGRAAPAKAAPKAAAKTEKTAAPDALEKELKILPALFETTPTVAELDALWPRVKAFNGTPHLDGLTKLFTQRKTAITVALRAQAKPIGADDVVPF